MGKLEGKVALVIGAGSADEGWGNGKACAVQFAREGASVVCVDRNGELAQQTAEIILGEGGNAIALSGDASSSKDMQFVVDKTVEHFGRVDVLLNNVGIVVAGGVVDLPEEEWDRVFDVNLKSAFLTMKYAVPYMINNGGGSIVNISSISAIRYLGKNYVAYYSSKAALNQMTKVSAAEYASKQVRVNAILPGLMDTPMARTSAKNNWGATEEELAKVWEQRVARVPMGWLGDAFDIAKAAVFFACDDSRFVTGQNLVVDGGTTLSS